MQRQIDIIKTSISTQLPSSSTYHTLGDKLVRVSRHEANADLMAEYNNWCNRVLLIFINSHLSEKEMILNAESCSDKLGIPVEYTYFFDATDDTVDVMDKIIKDFVKH